MTHVHESLFIYQHREETGGGGRDEPGRGRGRKGAGGLRGGWCCPLPADSRMCKAPPAPCCPGTTTPTTTIGLHRDSPVSLKVDGSHREVFSSSACVYFASFCVILLLPTLVLLLLVSSAYFFSSSLNISLVFLSSAFGEILLQSLWPSLQHPPPLYSSPCSTGVPQGGCLLHKHGLRHAARL